MLKSLLMMSATVLTAVTANSFSRSSEERNLQVTDFMPYDLQIIDRGLDRVTLQWEKPVSYSQPTDGYVMYIIQYKDLTSETQYDPERTVNSDNETPIRKSFVSLATGHEYEFTVVATYGNQQFTSEPMQVMIGTRPGSIAPLSYDGRVDETEFIQFSWTKAEDETSARMDTSTTYKYSVLQDGQEFISGETLENKVQLTGLQIQTEYQITVNAVNIVGFSRESLTFNVYEPLVGIPSESVVSLSDENQVDGQRFSFGSATNGLPVKEYCFQTRLGDQVSEEFVIDTLAFGNEFTIGRSNVFQYGVQHGVDLIVKSGLEKRTTSFVFTPNFVPSAPASLQVQPKTGNMFNGATLIWNDQEDHRSEGISQYDFTYISDNGDLQNIVISEGLDMNQLTLYFPRDHVKNYTATITARNQFGVSLPSQMVFKLILQDTNTFPPNAPTDFGRIDQNGDSITVGWTGDNTADTYVLQMRNGLQQWNDIYEGRESQYQVRNVQAGQTLSFRVFAKSIYGLSTPGELLNHIVTFPPRPVISVSIKTRSFSDLTFEFEPDTYNTGLNVQYKYRWKLQSQAEYSGYINIPDNLRTFKIQGLEAKQAYNLQITAYNAIGEATLTYSFIGEFTPNKVRDLKGKIMPDPDSSEINAHKILVTWREPEDTGLDNFTYKVVDLDRGVSSFTENKYFEFYQITLGQFYDYQVFAVNDHGIGVGSSIRVKTGEEPLPPRNLRQESATVNQLEICWWKPEVDPVLDIQQYQLEIFDSASDAWMTVTKYLVIDVQQLNHCYFVDGAEFNIVAGRVYNFRVAAINAVGYSEWINNEITAIFTPECPVMTYSEQTPDSVRVSWNKPGNGGSPIINYELTHIQSDIQKVHMISADEWTKTFEGLQQSTLQQFTMTAVNIMGRCPATEMSVYTLGMLQMPNNFIRTDQDWESNTLSWEAPTNSDASSVSSYLLEYKESSVNVWQTAMENNVLSYRIYGLTAGVTYNYRVFAQNAFGKGVPAYLTDTCTFLAEQPLPQISNINFENFRLSWVDTTVNAGTPITDYVLQTKLASESQYGLDKITVEQGLIREITLDLANYEEMREYDFRITPYNKHGEGRPAELRYVVNFVPGKILRFWASEIFETAIALSWTHVGNQDYQCGYMIRMEDNEFFDIGETYEYTFTGLQTDSMYRFDIRAYCTDAQSQTSIGEISTTNANTLSVPHCPLISRPVVETMVMNTVCWETSNDGGAQILGNTWEFKEASAENWFIGEQNDARGVQASVNVNNEQCVDFLGLVAGRRYEFRVTQTNKVGLGAPSNVFQWVANFKPSQPLNLRESDRSLEGFTLHWDEPESGAPLHGYEIKVDQNGVTRWIIRQEASYTHHYVKILDSQAEYSYQVRAKNSHNYGDWSARFTMILNRPTMPLNFDIVARTHESLIFGWEAPVYDGFCNIAYYRLCIFDGTNGVMVYESDAIPADQFTYELFGVLILDHRYDARLEVFNDCAFSNQAHIYNLLAQYCPEGPSMLTISNLDRTKFHLKWDAPSSNGGTNIAVENYEIELMGYNGETFMLNAADTQSWVEELQATYTYRIKVRAYNMMCAGPWSRMQQVTTFPITIPGTPMVLAEVAQDKTDETILMAWSAPHDDGGSPIVNYVLQYRGCSGHDDNDWSSTIHTPSLMYPVPDLVEGHRYDFRVWAENYVGMSKEAQYLYDYEIKYGTPKQRPQQPSTVGNLRVRQGSLGQTAVTLTWDQPIDNGFTIIGYYLTNGEGGLQQPINNNYITIQKLTPDTNYVFFVSAYNQFGESEAAKIVFTTLPTEPVIPNAPTNLTLEADMKSQTYKFSWDAPEFTGYTTITSYRLEMRQVGSPIWEELLTLGVSPQTGDVSINRKAIFARNYFTENANYDFRVFSINYVGESAQQATIINQKMDFENFVFIGAQALHQDLTIPEASEEHESISTLNALLIAIIVVMGIVIAALVTLMCVGKKLRNNKQEAYKATDSETPRTTVRATEQALGQQVATEV